MFQKWHKLDHKTFKNDSICQFRTIIHLKQAYKSNFIMYNYNKSYPLAEYWQISVIHLKNWLMAIHNLWLVVCSIFSHYSKMIIWFYQLDFMRLKSVVNKNYIKCLGYVSIDDRWHFRQSFFTSMTLLLLGSVNNQIKGGILVNPGSSKISNIFFN